MAWRKKSCNYELICVCTRTRIWGEFISKWNLFNEWKWFKIFSFCPYSELEMVVCICIHPQSWNCVAIATSHPMICCYSFIYLSVGQTLHQLNRMRVSAFNIHTHTLIGTLITNKHMEHPHGVVYTRPKIDWTIERRRHDTSSSTLPSPYVHVRLHHHPQV